MKSICFFVLSLLLFNCQKKTTNCDAIQHAYASTNGPVTIGDTIKIHTQEVGGYRLYSWRGPNYFTSQEPRNIIYDAELKHEGWYYVTISNNECYGKADSVYVDVKLKQGTPPCSIPNNTCEINNQFSDAYSSVVKQFNPTTDFLMLEGRGPSSLEIDFHPYWKTKEPEDGIYDTVDIPSFGIDGNYNKVFISTVKSNIYFSCRENQKVYVSHVNGKLQVRFCNLTMGGYNGYSFTTIASGNLIQQ
ncbi:MAG: hypothetical protein ABI675_07350 [Chitinophagaceae bacterium]